MSRFSNLAHRLNPKRAVEQLVKVEENPEPQGYTRSSTGVKARDYDVNRPQDSLDEYWRLYETNPLLSYPIDTTASKVIEPGWYITADSDTTVDELTEFFERVAIVNGEPHQNFSQLAEQAVIQHQIKGTFLTERVTTDDDKPQALNPLQVNTFEIYTKPGSNILLAPDDTQLDGVKKTDNDDAAAYVQFDANDPRWEDRKEKRFARDEILKWTRGNEVGEVFGTSRVESVYERALALEAKLRDNDDAIAMKAWPMVLFQMGTEENPWRKTEIQDFMGDFDAENFGPGLMKAVSGDVDVKEFAGETADIESAVNTDVSFIMSGMPGPMYALGGFSQAQIGKEVAQAQDRQYTKLVRRLRRDLENLFTPYLREVAEAYDLDAPDSVELHIQRPNGQVAPEDVSGSIIRYTSDVSGGAPEDAEADPANQPPSQPAETEDGQTVQNQADPDPDPDASTPDLPAGSTELLAAGDDTCTECTVEELADPRLVSTTSLEDDLADTIFDILTATRSRVLDRIQGRYSEAGEFSQMKLRTIAESAYVDAVTEADLSHVATQTFRQTATQTLDTLGQENHTPQIDVTYSRRHARLVQENARALRDDVDRVGDTLTSTFVQQLAQASTGSESVETWAERARQALATDWLRQRAELIAHMRVHRVVNGLKHTEYERHNAVAGVRVINPCTDATTPLCERLAGCGRHEAQVALFETEQTIGEQLGATVSDDLLFDRFAPLPSVPPYHFGCRSELVAVLADDADADH